MHRMPRNALTAWIAWWVLRRRLRRSDHLLAAVGVAGLELFGPRLFLVRRLFVLLAALTVIGLVAIALVWWVLHQRGTDDGEDDEADAPVPPPDPDASDLFVAVDDSVATAGA
jgi:hypothetical protein